MNGFYTIIVRHVGDIAGTNAAIEGALNLSTLDWLRVNGFAYLVKSSEGPPEIYNRVAAVVPQDADIVVMGVDLNERFGRATNLVVNWILKHSP